MSRPAILEILLVSSQLLVPVLSLTGAATCAEEPAPRLDQARKPAHPDLPERPMPTVCDAPVLPDSPGEAKSPLAWRHKAVKLSLDKFKTEPLPEKPSACKQSYAATYSDTLSCLAGAITEAGLQINTLNKGAGEVLATDAESKFVFTVWEQNGKSWISAGIEKNKNAATLKIIQSILDRTNSFLSKRGQI